MNDSMKTMISPYRNIGDNVVIENYENIFPFDKNFCCPACLSNNRFTSEGKLTKFFSGCVGKRRMFSNRYKCPNVPHLHVECWACGLRFMMWSV